MPELLVSLKTNLSDDQYNAALKHIEDKGGKIVDKSNGRGTLSPFVTVEYPEDSVSTLEQSEHIESVEKNGEVKTQ